MDSKLKALEEVYAYAQRAQELGIPIEDVARLRKMETEERWVLVREDDYPNRIWWVFVPWSVAHENGLPTPFEYNGYSSTGSRSDYIWADGPGWGDSGLHAALKEGYVPVHCSIVTDELPIQKRPNAKKLAIKWAEKHIGRRSKSHA